MSCRTKETFTSSRPKCFRTSLLFGLGHRFAGEVHVHIERLPGESLNYEAIAPAAHFQLTPPESEAPWKFAVAAEYELARHSDENSFAARLIAARSFSSSSTSAATIAVPTVLTRDTRWGSGRRWRPATRGASRRRAASNAAMSIKSSSASTRSQMSDSRSKPVRASGWESGDRQPS